MGIGVFGKHPVFGDFLSAGLPGGGQALIEEWLGQVLPELRQGLGGVWEAVYDAAPPLSFWIGGGLTGTGPLCGVLVWSRDSVGRRFPLILASGGNLPPPVADPVPGITLGAALLERLAGLVPDPAAGAAGLAGAFADCGPEEGGAEVPDPGFWAARGDDDLIALWSDVAATDHLRAAGGRSYWWTATGGASCGLYATEGLPPAPVLAWLLSGAGASGADTEPAEAEDVG